MGTAIGNSMDETYKTLWADFGMTSRNIGLIVEYAVNSREINRNFVRAML
jgi:hypothetical protein